VNVAIYFAVKLSSRHVLDSLKLYSIVFIKCPNKILINGACSSQGPALYAYNDAQFTKEDWTGIRMLCDSVKIKDPMKVGRFGLGFKSVFHVTGKDVLYFLLL